jgi:hypothetical protein
MSKEVVTAGRQGRNQEREEALNSYREMELMPNPNQKEQQILYQGDVYEQSNGKWNLVERAILTAKSFMNIEISAITKLKIKAESQVNGTRMLKICTDKGDHFFSVRVEEQAEWMMKLVWAKLISMGVMCKIVSNYSGQVEGPIIRKDFWGTWEQNYGRIKGQTFTIAPALNYPVSKTITEVP